MLPILTAINTMRAEAHAILEAANLIEAERFYSIAKIVADVQHGQKVVVTGVGKSAIAARKIAATFSTVGIPGLFYDAVGLYHGELGAIQHGDVVMLISHSGETDELLRLLPSLNAKGAVLCAIVGKAESTLGRLPKALCTGVQSEMLRIPTRSFAATVAIGDGLAMAAAELRGATEHTLAADHPGGMIGRKSAVQ